MYLQEAAEATAAADSGLQLGAYDQPPGPLNSMPRPPQMMKKHVPCTDTSHKNVDDFLEHLKTLSWYSGQVGQECDLLTGVEMSPQHVMHRPRLCFQDCCVQSAHFMEDMHAS